MTVRVMFISQNREEISVEKFCLKNILHCIIKEVKEIMCFYFYFFNRENLISSDLSTILNLPLAFPLLLRGREKKP